MWSGEICSNIRVNFLQLKCPSIKAAPQTALITCSNLQMSDVCLVQCRHINCLVQSQCCQLILHIHGSYIQLEFRHNSPFHMGWLSVCVFLTHGTRESTLTQNNCDCSYKSSTDSSRTAYTWNNICSNFCLFHKGKIVPSCQVMTVHLHSFLPWYYRDECQFSLLGRLTPEKKETLGTCWMGD